MKTTKVKRKRNAKAKVVVVGVSPSPANNAIVPDLTRSGQIGPFGKYGANDYFSGSKTRLPKGGKLKKTRVERYRFPQKRTGPMSTKTVSVPGIQSISDLTGTVYTYTETRPSSSTDYLVGIVSAHGDFKNPTAHQYRKQHVMPFAGTVARSGPRTDFRTVSGSNQQPFSPPAEFYLNFPHGGTYNIALGKLYEKLRGDLDVSIDLAESHKTHVMMRDTFRAMKNLSLTFHKMRRSNPRDWGNLWLEFTYGWTPLAHSIYGIGEQLLVKPALSGRILVTASHTERMVDRTYFPGTFYSVGDKLVWTAMHSSRCRFAIYYGLAPNRLDALAGFTSLNPISIAWELTPYSFVVDWFVNVGGYLRNYENALLYGSSFVSGYMTQTQLTQQTGFDQGGSTVGNVSYAVDLQGNQSIKDLKRTVLSSSPYPRRPRFEPKLGSSRLISAAALLGQQLSSLKHPKMKVEKSVWDSTWTGVFDWLGAPGVHNTPAPDLRKPRR